MVLHLWAQGLEEGDEHPHALLWSMVDFTVKTFSAILHGMNTDRNTWHFYGFTSLLVYAWHILFVNI